MLGRMADADWDLFQSLHAVLEAGTFSAAARLRGLTQPTLGRHIDELERRLGGPLFVRSPRGVQPTELAIGLKPHLEDMAAAAATAVRDASGLSDGAIGSVRVTTSEVMGVEVLPPMLTRFRRKHPGIDIELTVSNENADLSRRDADIAVRMARPTQNTLIARRIGAVGFGFYATPDYLEAYGEPKDLEALAEHTVIGFDRTSPPIPPGLDIGRPITRDVFGLRTDTDAAQLAALRAGFGIGYCQHQFGRRWGLVGILPGLIKFELEVWVAMHENLKASRRMRLMFDHLAADLSAYVAQEKAA